MAAEEAKDPKVTIPRAYIGGILTLLVLAIGYVFSPPALTARMPAHPVDSDVA